MDEDAAAPDAGMEFDEEMVETEEAADVEVEAEAENDDGNAEPNGDQADEPAVLEHATFLDCLQSPMVEIVIGTGEARTVLHAHQASLIKAPLFATECARFADDSAIRRIELPDDDVDATAAVLEYLYKGDYFPRLKTAQTVEEDATLPTPDEGIGLLRHGRVYTLAQRVGLPQLAKIAHRKIHISPATAKGEITYARFVYSETMPDDNDIRKPVAAFWASRSHVLRHEAETDFRSLCLEYPQFGFDVLSLVLDRHEKQKEREQPTPRAAGRKRQRVSGIVDLS